MPQLEKNFQNELKKLQASPPPRLYAFSPMHSLSTTRGDFLDPRSSGRMTGCSEVTSLKRGKPTRTRSGRPTIRPTSSILPLPALLSVQNGSSPHQARCRLLSAHNTTCRINGGARLFDIHQRGIRSTCMVDALQHVLRYVYTSRMAQREDRCIRR
jgi:hypothetical protein